MYSINVLFVEDDVRIREIVRKYFEQESFHVYEAGTGKQAHQLLDEQDFQLVILDVMLPDTDGWTLLKAIRRKKDVPVIMLTARSEEEDKLFGFELGADDYITKPFSTRLLIARAKAVLKRDNIQSVHHEIQINGIRLNKDYRQVYVGEQKLDLTPIEYSLLIYFMDNLNIALSRNQILDHVWGYDYYGDERTVDTHVKRLRKKLLTQSDCIETIRGHGYRMVKNK